jgi:hypothetical protein
MLWIGVVTMLLAVALDVSPDQQRVFVRGFPSAQVPGTCMSRELFHVDCPGCGLTRSIILLGHGQWRASWRMHRIGWVMALAIVAQIPYRILCLRRGATVLGTLVPRVCASILIFLLIANWLVGLS